jgi:Xaa-Pro aminopeptidase
MTELEVKLGRIRDLLKQHAIDALLLQRVDNFAWATCGAASYVNWASSSGAASLLITASGRWILTDNIEAGRLQQEERLQEQGWEFGVAPWYEENQAVAELTRGLTLAADGAYAGAADLSAALPPLRAALTSEEDSRFRRLGTLCAEAMDSAIRAVRPGMTEYQISGLLAREALSRGVQPIVNLIAVDERISRFRHPLPTDRQLESYAMLVLCGRMWGLICSLTRLVYFGRLPDTLRRRADAVAQVDAQFILASRPGQRLRDVLNKGIDAYRAAGFPGEWQRHHQGGLAGYAPREIVATPASDEEVVLGQAYAWNPSITGVKSEDTILVGNDGNEILTAIPGWPTIRAKVNGGSIERPGILEIV